MINDPRNLAVVTIVILQPNQLGDRLKGLRDYMRAYFLILRHVRLPFAPLPWAKTPPPDVDSYAGNPAHASF